MLTSILYLQSCFGVRVDLSSATDGNLTETATGSSQVSKKPQLPPIASSVQAILPTPATTLSSGGESDTEGQPGTGSDSPKPVTGGSDGVMETVSLPAVTVGSTQTGATSSSGGSGDEGGGGKREAKRKLIDALEEFAPKRRSSRVCVKDACVYIDYQSSLCCVFLFGALHALCVLCLQMKSRKRENPRQSCFEMLKKYMPSWMM